MKTENETASIAVTFEGVTTARIAAVGAVFSLTWDDGVANEWVEYYPTIATALMRLAVLSECQKEITYGTSFVNDEVAFCASVDGFLRENIAD